MTLQSHDKDDLSRDLQQLGFTDYESRVYLALLQSAPATAYEISKNNALMRPNVYSALESLERKNAVQRVNHDPVRFVPISPQIMLDRISRTVEERCSSLQYRLDKMKEIEKTQYVWTVNAVKEARVQIREIIANAKHHIWIKAHHAELEPHVDELRNAAGRGVSILLVLFGGSDDLKLFRFPENTVVYAHEGNGTVVGLARDLITLTADFQQALIMHMKDEAGAYTQSEPVVNLADSLIRHEVYLAEIFNYFGGELEEHFGPALLELRKKYLPKEQARILEERLTKQVGA
ncbi:MAG TPA: helix-turn-helix domain-containing protein [Halomonas sp.]|nr:helix-turn-helix domain-containing protein [Halomonas sp.]